jgi:hypothetical protein
MEQSASEASTPFQAFEVVHTVCGGIVNARVVGSGPPLPATATVGELSAPPLVERAPCGLSVLQRVEALRRREDTEEVPGSAFLRWYDETRILEVHGILFAAPHAAP